MRWILFLTACSLAAQSALPAPDALRAAMDKQKAAAAQQRLAAKKQAESVGAWLVSFNEPDGRAPMPSAGAEAGPNEPCDALPEETAAPMIEAAASAQNLQSKLLRAVIDQESRFHPCAVSAKGAKGMMQLMPDTARDLGVEDPFDARQNIEAGARYLRQLLDKYKGDVAQALAAYNAGSNTVDQAGGIPNIKETKDYVNSILQKVGTIQIDPPSIPMPKPIGN